MGGPLSCAPRLPVGPPTTAAQRRSTSTPLADSLAWFAMSPPRDRWRTRSWSTDTSRTSTRPRPRSGVQRTGRYPSAADLGIAAQHERQSQPANAGKETRVTSDRSDQSVRDSVSGDTGAVMASNNAVSDPHPLFPDANREVAFIFFRRRAADGSVERSPRTWAASQIQSWNEVFERWGGGEYKAYGTDKWHRMIGVARGGPNWARFEGASQPFVPPPAPPAPPVPLNPLVELLNAAFEGTPLDIVREDDLLVRVAPICRALGISSAAALRKLECDPVWGVCRMRVPVPGGAREMACLRLHLLPAWLFTLKIDDVRASLHPKLLAFKHSAADMLGMFSVSALVAALDALEVRAAGERGDGCVRPRQRARSIW
jgi:hypothetical protein